MEEKNVSLLLRAISFAARAHKHQFRKDNQTPYVSHVFRVCMILRHVFNVKDEKILAATMLHDTIEDTKVDFDDIDKGFGRDIARWVGMLSKDKRLLEDEREIAYFEQLQKAPIEVKLIKLADIYDNILDSTKTSTKEHLSRTLAKSQEHLDSLENNGDARLNKALEIVEELIKDTSLKLAKG